MATLDTSYVRKQLRTIASVSKVVEQLLYDALAGLESNPTQFAELDDVPADIRTAYGNAVFRKIYLVSGKHSFRLVVIHWTFRPQPPDTEKREHVDVVMAFARKKGYQIDWAEMEREFLEGSTEEEEEET